MIAEQYILEGIRIRKVYIQNLKEIIKYEPKISSKKVEFMKLQEEMESVVKSSEFNEIRKTVVLNDKLIELEKQIISIQDIIKPFSENIENLKNDRDRLYISIKEKYPTISDKQIEQDIMSRIEE